MRNLKNILLSLIIAFSTSSFSEVAEVYQWKAFPGKSMEMMESMLKAAEIHEKQGVPFVKENGSEKKPTT